MSSCPQGDKAPYPEPWSDDESLKNYRHMGTINKVVGLTQELDEIMEKTVIGSMTKTKSIAMLWEEAKDLSSESIHELQSALCDL
jgi:hypothetical protein